MMIERVRADMLTYKFYKKKFKKVAPQEINKKFTPPDPLCSVTKFTKAFKHIFVLLPNASPLVLASVDLARISFDFTIFTVITVLASANITLD